MGSWFLVMGFEFWVLDFEFRILGCEAGVKNTISDTKIYAHYFLYNTKGI